MARAKTKDNVFTLGPEMRLDKRENDREEFAERLQRVARKMTADDGVEEEASTEKETPERDEYPEALKGFTFHNQDHGKGMLFAVVAAPLTFVACVIGAVSILGPLGEASQEGDVVAAAEQVQSAARVVEANEAVLVPPPLQANAVVEPLQASITIAERYRAQNDWTIKIPAGAAIEKVDLDQGRLAIHLETEGRKSVLAYDTVSGGLTENGVTLGAPNAGLVSGNETTSELVSLTDERGVLPPSLKTRL